MKKLGKKFISSRETIQAYACSCDCACNCPPGTIYYVQFGIAYSIQLSGTYSPAYAQGS
ncbi:MAG: CLI_3235 family bacteriocin precursor [Spirochaetales bacterium]|nr:CLI_3235 family bacteriocin precursor [Spirochaetales bacterium]